MADLTTLALVKEYLGKSDSDSDTILARLISAESAKIEAYLGRLVGSDTYAAEVHSGHGREALKLKHRPATAVSEVREDGAALDSSLYELDQTEGVLYAKNTAGGASTWTVGSRNLEVDYTAGYSTIPKDIEEAATRQTAYVYQLSSPGGDRLGDRGTIYDAGGSAQYLTGPWAQGVLATLEPHREAHLG